MSTVPRESWNFSLDDYAVQHQGIHVIDLDISYDYRPGLGLTNPFEYPNFVPIANFINDFIVSYPNETDFWEILNRKLVGALLAEAIPTPYGSDYRLGEMVDDLSISLTVHPYTAIPYSRTSTVEQDVVVGTDAADRLEGGDYRDALRGGAEADTLHGRGDDDYVSGGLGNDRLYGDAGNDDLVGGLGAD
ncbi:MAG: calcium-binding protein, partial [Acetobacteraceae bacterium]